MTKNARHRRCVHYRVILGLALTFLVAACTSQDVTAGAGEPVVDAESTDVVTVEPRASDSSSTDPGTTEPDNAEPANEVASYQVEVWVDNWMAVYVDGALIGEDSVPITTERSFNSETFSFEAAAPFTVAIEAKDFKETDSGIEYIGEQNQQIGDGGVIAQITNVETGEIVSVTNSSWAALVVHQAPLNPECVADSDPDSTCEFAITEAPTDWTSANFDDTSWDRATEWSANAVDPKDGYGDIAWDSTAEFIWGADLEVDNTVLLRAMVS